MLNLNNSELMNIYVGKGGFALPNFDAYIKIFNWIYKTVKSWFYFFAVVFLLLFLIFNNI